jgi:hypothetical protein
MEVRKVKKQLNLRLQLPQIKTLILKAMAVEYTPTPRFIVNLK